DAFDAISVAEPERIVLQADLDGDGAAASRGETIAWRLAGAVLRRDAGGGAQPVVEGVLRLRLEYLDFAGRPTRVPGEVRSVVITLTTEGGQPGAGGATTLTTRVGRRIAEATGRADYQWEFSLIEDKQANAFCLPGGKVAVYTGILPLTRDDAGLAAVLGHEVAHAIARHGGERVSQGLLVQVPLA